VIGRVGGYRQGAIVAIRAPSLPLLLGVFAGLGGMFGVWQVLLADLSRALNVSPGPLGVALSLGFLLSLPVLSLGGRLVERWGLRATIVVAGTVNALAIVSAALLGRFWQLLFLLPIFCAATGVYDVAINATAVRFEGVSGRRVLPICHAAFSGGGAAGAIAAGLLVTAGVPFRALYLGVALLIGAVQVLVWHGALPPLAAQASPETADTARLLRNPALLLLTVVTVLAFLSEGTMENWSAIYLRSSLALPAILGASGVAIFHLAMMVGRLGTAGALRLVSRLALLRVAGICGVGGMVLALATTAAPLILLGILLVGLAFSGVVPVALSLIGEIAPDRAGRATAAVMTVGYAGFLVGPPLIGGLAEWFSLRLALATVILFGAIVAALASMPLARRSFARR